MKLGITHQMTPCKGRCSGTWRLSRQAFWEHAAVFQSQWGTVTCLPMSLDNTPSLPLATIFPTPRIWSSYLGFSLFTHMLDGRFLSRHIITTHPLSFRRASRVRKDRDESEWGLRGRKRYVVWSVQLLGLAFMISTHVHKFLRFVRTAPVYSVCVNCWYEVDCLLAWCCCVEESGGDSLAHASPWWFSQRGRKSGRRKKEESEREREREWVREDKRREKGGADASLKLGQLHFQSPHFNEIKRLSLSHVEKEEMKGYKSVLIEKKGSYLLSALDWVTVPISQDIGLSSAQSKSRRSILSEGRLCRFLCSWCQVCHSIIKQVYWKHWGTMNVACMHVFEV